MKTLHILFFALLIGLFNLSCDRSEEDMMISSGIEIQKEAYLKGSKSINNHQLSFEVKMIDDAHFLVYLLIDKYTLEATVDYRNEAFVIDGHQVILTKDQKQALLMLGEQLSSYLFKDGSADSFTMAEYTLLRLLEYWSKSPNSHIYKKMNYQGVAQKSVDEGISCIRRNTIVIASYNDDNGREFNESKLVDGDRCLGRCGAGCSQFFSIASAWTKDCLDHDACGRALGGSTNPFDDNCGDEYAQAADDFLFGVFRGCRG